MNHRRGGPPPPGPGPDASPASVNAATVSCLCAHLAALALLSGLTSAVAGSLPLWPLYLGLWGRKNKVGSWTNWTGRTSSKLNYTIITWLAPCRILLISSSSSGEFLLLSDGDRHSSLQTASLPSRPFPYEPQNTTKGMMNHKCESHKCRSNSKGINAYRVDLWPEHRQGEIQMEHLQEIQDQPDHELTYTHRCRVCLLCQKWLLPLHQISSWPSPACILTIFSVETPFQVLVDDGRSFLKGTNKEDEPEQDVPLQHIKGTKPHLQFVLLFHCQEHCCPHFRLREHKTSAIH